MSYEGTMARTYPSTLLEDDVKSRGEIKVFNALRDGLGDEWEVFHSVSWVRRDPGTGAEDGEIDFVARPPGSRDRLPRGQGRRPRVPVRRVVTRRGRDSWERSRDPFTQALDHRYALERLIDDVDGWRGRDLLDRARRRAAGHPRPLARARAGRSAPSSSSTTVRSTDVAGALERVLAFHRGARERAPCTGRVAGVAMLRDLLAPAVHIEVPMAAAFLEEERALVELTREQSLLLSPAAAQPAHRVYGCAGSGKTMLAVEHAKRLAADGQDVLFVCFNVRPRSPPRDH